MSLSDADIRSALDSVNAVLRGHFVLSSGLHSDTYVQCAKIFEHPAVAEKLCRELASRCEKVPVVVGPAYGGIILAYELARHLGARALFVERTDGKFSLRRGFAIAGGERALVSEDVITTGGSALEAAALVQSLGAEVVGIASVIDRRTKPGDLKLTALLKVEAATYPGADCPLCARGVPTTKPGSRGQA